MNLKIANRQYMSLSQSVKKNEKEAKAQAFSTLVLSFLWILPFTLVLYWIVTFIGGALWTLWDTTEKIVKGDLTSRLGFQEGRDEFGIIVCTLDRAMDTLSELVETVKANAITLHSTSSSFSNESKQSEDQINQIDSKRTRHWSQLDPKLLS